MGPCIHIYYVCIYVSWGTKKNSDIWGPFPYNDCISNIYTHNDCTCMSACDVGGEFSKRYKSTRLICEHGELFRQHWLVPPLDGDPVTAATFHSGSNGLLIVTTSANVLHVLDVEAKRLGEWSRQHGNRLPRTFLEFPGGIQGLSFCPSTKSTTVIAYSSK